MGGGRRLYARDVSNKNTTIPRTSAVQEGSLPAIGYSSSSKFDSEDPSGMHPATADESRAAQVLTWGLENAASKIVSLCKDEMNKEAIAEEWKTKQLRYRKGDFSPPTYWKCVWDNGVLEFQYGESGPHTNVIYTGSDILEGL